MSIDPIEFGKVLARLDTQDEAIADMRKDIKSLLAMANQGKGGLWALTSFSAVIGAVITEIARHLFFTR